MTLRFNETGRRPHWAGGGHPAARRSGRAERVVDRALELAVELDGALVGEGEDLGHDHAADPPRRIDPVIGVEDAGPGQAAGAAAVRAGLYVDHVAETPFQA